jgi:hypothetical protein
MTAAFFAENRFEQLAFIAFLLIGTRFLAALTKPRQVK